MSCLQSNAACSYFLCCRYGGGMTPAAATVLFRNVRAPCHSNASDAVGLVIQYVAEVAVARCAAQCAPCVTLTHQTNRVKVCCYSRQRQGLLKSFSAPSEETWRATMNLQMFDDSWKIVGSPTRTAEM